MTLKELAAACGISVSAVSKALNGYPDVGEETRALVCRKAEELGYRPNAVARALKSGRTYNLGILFADLAHGGLTHSYFGPVIDAFKKEAEANGYEVTFLAHRTGSGRMTYLEHCRTRGFDGVCIVNFNEMDEEIRELVQSKIPLVSIDYAYPNRSCVRSNNEEGILRLTQYILSRGHRRVAFISGENTGVTRTRREGFLRIMKAAGFPVPPEYLVQSVFHDPGSAHRAVAQLLELPERPSCIMVQDDLSALGGMEAIRERGLRIPEDISIVGYDGVHLLQLCTPRLTTYAQDTARIGQEAAGELIRLIEAPEEEKCRVLTVNGRLLIGDTVAQL